MKYTIETTDTGFDDAALDVVYELHDGCYELDFMRLAKAAELF